MSKHLHELTKAAICHFVCLLVCAGYTVEGIAQTSSCTAPPPFMKQVQYPNMRQKIKTHLAIGGTVTDPRFKGLLEYTPVGYNPSDLTKQYPVIIYFPGKGAISDINNNDDPCYMLYDVEDALPQKIEQGNFKDSILYLGQWYKFIFLSFQYNRYNYPGDFPSTADVEAVINYTLLTYRVDPSRIYLTGMSAGANMPLEFIGNSTERASHIAAVTLASECSSVGFVPNSNQAPANIAAGGTATWFMVCQTDAACPPTKDTPWVMGINNSNPIHPAQYTVLKPFPQTPSCEGFAHDTWNKMYDTAFKVNGKNFYEFIIQFTASAPLPVVLKNFTARLNNGKVYLQWTTVLETDAGSFTIEKAGGDQRFAALNTIKTTSSSSTEKTYQYIDDKPLPNLSYYRLLQTDKDGRKKYFETRRILNRENSKLKLLVFPNPFINDLSAFLNISRSQRVNISISDLSGRKVYTNNNTYSEGNVEITINTAQLSKGVYLLKAEGEDFTEIQRVVKQ